MSVLERWRYRCADCGSVALTPRVSAAGYRCEGCGLVMTPSERADAKRAT